MTRFIFGDACKPKSAPQLYITSILVFTVSIAVLTASAELHQHTLTIDATDRENWAYINLTKGETVDIADKEAINGIQSRVFITSRGMCYLSMS